MHRSIVFASVLGCFVVACSASDTHDGAPAPTPAQDGGGAGVADAGPVRSPACLAFDAQMQAALDKKPSKVTSPNVVIGVKNEACGTSVYMSGDPANATSASLFRMGSVTKTFVSAAIMSLIKDGAVGLEDPIDKWVPTPAHPGVTIHMLLNHTSGLADYMMDVTVARNPKTARTPLELVTIANGDAPTFAPGAGWSYSNTNYVLLGMVAEAAGKATLGAVLHARGIDRVGLSATFFDGEDTLPQGALAKGFNGNKTDVTNMWDPSIPWAAGSMVASGSDLAEWVYALYGSDAVLDAPTRAQLIAPPLYDVGDGVSKYGLGVIVIPPSATGGGGQGIGHAGDIDGYHTMAFYFPDKKTSLSAYVNEDGAQPYYALQEVFPVAFAAAAPASN